MGAYIFYVIISSFLFLNLHTHAFVTNCSHGSVGIRFPFQVFGQVPQHSRRSGFNLVCKENSTFIHFPSYGDLVVKSISYDVKRIDLLDPKNCAHQVFLNLNLSLTPFQYYYDVKNYTYLNCSTRLLPSNFLEVPCLSGSNHHVYTVESSSAVPGSCRAVKTVAIPFSYSPYLEDSSFGLGLTWNLPGCSQDCEATGRGCEFPSKTGFQAGCINLARNEGFSIKNTVLSEVEGKFWKIVLCIFAVAALLSVKIYQRNKVEFQVEIEKLLVA